VKRKTYKKWNPPLMAGFPMGLVMHPAGANRLQRRTSREHKNDPMPPSSMRPHVKVTIFDKHEPAREVKIPDGVEYVPMD
jgi:hypothetical protein